MCILSNLVFPLDKSLSLPPLTSSYIKCTPCPVSDEEINHVPSKLPFENSRVIEVNVSSANLLTEGEDVKTVVELMLDTSEGCDLNYLPGDTIGILPENPEKEVECLLNRLNINNFGCKVEICDDHPKNKLGLPAHIPRLTTARFLFKKCLDLRAIVKKGLLRSLIDFTEDEAEKRRLKELCSKEGSGEYNSQILIKKSSIIEVLEAFPSCHPPLSLLLEHLPRLQPRPYSIASSPLESPNRLRIIFNVVFDSRNRRGVCSGWLYDTSKVFFDISTKLGSLSLNESDRSPKVSLYLRKFNQFRVPQNSSIPLVMIGAGTGVAPFVGFLEHRRSQLSNSEIKQSNWLLFGCRYPNRDEIYRDLFVKLDDENCCHYLVSYSRGNESDTGNRYVQDLLKEHGIDIVNQLITTDSCLYICGSLTVEKQVLDSLIDCFKTVKGICEEEAKTTVEDLEKSGRILKDVWV